MIKFFTYDVDYNKVVVNEPEILLVKEFADLWTNERNKTKDDPDGHLKTRGFRELIYIYMAIDWGAPGSKDTPANRQKYAIEASQLTEEELEDPIFKAACQKYKDLQDQSSTIGPMIQMFRNKLHEIQLFIESIDYNERTDSGTPVFKVKETFDAMQQLSKVVASLKQLEPKYKDEIQEASGLRGDTTPGMFD